MTDPTAPLDGNAAAGALSDVFAADVTAARGCCAGCGAVAPLARSTAWLAGPGVVLRCAVCEAVLLRVVTAGHRTWLELRGLAWLELAGT